MEEIRLMLRDFLFSLEGLGLIGVGVFVLISLWFQWWFIPRRTSAKARRAGLDGMNYAIISVLLGLLLNPFCGLGIVAQLVYWRMVPSTHEPRTRRHAPRRRRR